MPNKNSPTDHSVSATGQSQPLAGRIISRPSSWIELEDPAQIIIPSKTTNAIHTAMNRGIDKHNWGVKRVNRQTGEIQVQWHMRNDTMDNWLKTHDHHASYRRELNKRHLQHQATHYFSGGTDGEYTLLGFDLDVHNNENDVQQVWELINSYFPNLHPESSTGGKGIHAIFKISLQRKVQHGKITINEKIKDKDLNKLTHNWHIRLKTAIAALGYQSSAEIKGICCYKNNKGKWVRGSLMRRPRTLTAEQINSLPVYGQAGFEKRIVALEILAGLRSIPTTVPATENTPAPQTTPKATTTKQVQQKAQRTAPDTTNGGTGRRDWKQEDAWHRMIHAKCDYVRIYSQLPPDAETLCDHYESLGLANQETRHPGRLTRASSILKYAQTIWIENNKGKIDHTAYLSEVQRRIPKPQGITHQELSAVLAVMTENSLQISPISKRYNGTCPTKAIIGFMNRLTDEDGFGRIWCHRLNRLAVQLLTEGKLLGKIHRVHRTGRSRVYRLGQKHPRYQEWAAFRDKHLVYAKKTAGTAPVDYSQNENPPLSSYSFPMLCTTGWEGTDEEILRETEEQYQDYFSRIEDGPPQE